MIIYHVLAVLFFVKQFLIVVVLYIFPLLDLQILISINMCSISSIWFSEGHRT